VCNFPFLPYVRPPRGVDVVYFWSLTSLILVVAEEAGGREEGTGHYAFYTHYAHYTTSRKQDTTGANVGSVLRTDSPGDRSDVRRSTN
jgi:hypothetical protein